MDYFAYINKTLYCEDVNLQEIVEEYGTPTYVYSKKTIERHVDVYKKAFKLHKNLICISVKSLSNISILDLINKKGCGFDVVSGGELKRALHAGADPKKIIYCSDLIAQSSALNICLSDNKEVIKSDPLIDAQFLPWLESKNEDYQFQRVDSEINELEDKESKEIVDKDGKSNTDNLRDTIVKALNNEKVTVKVQSLSSKDAPPAMILLPEQMRRINDMGAYMEQKMPGLPEYHVLLINKEHPLIVGLNKITGNKIIIDEKDPIENPLASKIANHVYDMAKLSVGGLDQEQIINLQNNNAELISELLNSTN